MAIRISCGRAWRGAVPKANTRGAADLPRVVRSCYAYRCMFQHVIARSEATWQSASPQESLPGCCCLGEFVMPYVFAEKTAFGSALLRGNGLPHLVAPKSAMSSPQSPPCPAPAKGQSRATLPWVSFPHKACRFAGPRGYAGQRPEQGNAPLGLLSPQRDTLCGAPMHWFAMTCRKLACEWVCKSALPGKISPHCVLARCHSLQ